MRPDRDAEAPHLEIQVNAPDHLDAPVALIERGVRHAASERVDATGEVSVTLLSDADIQELNRTYLGHDRPTDVISFSLGDDASLLGDVYVGYQQAERQALELGVALDEELVRLAIHGTLHVLGHDHPEGPERVESPMFALQERVLADVLRRADGRVRPPAREDRP